jgi:hypothetical protein
MLVHAPDTSVAATALTPKRLRTHTSGQTIDGHTTRVETNFRHLEVICVHSFERDGALVHRLVHQQARRALEMELCERKCTWRLYTLRAHARVKLHACTHTAAAARLTETQVGIRAFSSSRIAIVVM